MFCKIKNTVLFVILLTGCREIKAVTLEDLAITANLLDKASSNSLIQAKYSLENMNALTSNSDLLPKNLRADERLVIVSTISRQVKELHSPQLTEMCSYQVLNAGIESAERETTQSLIFNDRFLVKKNVSNRSVSYGIFSPEQFEKIQNHRPSIRQYLTRNSYSLKSLSELYLEIKKPFYTTKESTSGSQNLLGVYIGQKLYYQFQFDSANRLNYMAEFHSETKDPDSKTFLVFERSFSYSDKGEIARIVEKNYRKIGDEPSRLNNVSQLDILSQNEVKALDTAQLDKSVQEDIEETIKQYPVNSLKFYKNNGTGERTKNLDLAEFLKIISGDSGGE